jgi:uncharacterized repeat protein (TIGR03803 family)
MKSSILSTLRATLIAKSSPQSGKEDNVKKPCLAHSLARMACIVSVFCAATAILSSAQTKFSSLVSFNGNNGADPHNVYLVQGPDGELYGTTYVSTGSGGTVFKVTTAGALTTLHTFCDDGCLDGELPAAGLVLASNGIFYGTTSNGGANSDGTVFSITSAGTLTTLHSFDLTDGANPEYAMIQASNGNFYGTTSSGGTGDIGTIFEITPAGTLTSLHSFDGNDGDYPDSSLVQGKSGKLYGTTYEGGGGSGTVFEMTLAGALTTWQHFDPADGGGNTGTLIQASNGNFYGTTQGGGSNAVGSIYEITTAGKLTTLYSFCSKKDCTDGATPYAGLIQGSDGNLYGTTAGGGASTPSCNGGCGTIFKITTAGELTTLYNFCSQANCTDGNVPQGGLVQHTNGDFYGTTYYGGADGIGTIFSLSVGLKPFVKMLPNLAEVGAQVLILGTNLTGATKVSFNGVAAKFTVVSSTEIKATVPAGATSGTVTVVTPNGTLKTIVIFEVTPQIKSFTPASGPVGTAVTITGVSLTQTSAVTFDGIAATDFIVDSDTEVTATVPTDAKTGKIAITTAGGTASSTTSFSVTE